jgi:hypothetical protein
MSPSPAVHSASPQPIWPDRAARFYAQGMDRPQRQPNRSALFPWSFSARFETREEAFAHCAMQLRLSSEDERHDAPREHLRTALKPLAEGGLELSAPKLSALLIWDLG